MHRISLIDHRDLNFRRYIAAAEANTFDASEQIHIVPLTIESAMNKTILEFSLMI